MVDNNLNENKMVEEESSALSIKEIWTIIILNWYWIVLSLIVSLGLAFAYLRYTRPVYATSMKVLIKDDDGPQSRSAANALDQLGMGMMSNSNGFDNELEILTSTNIATRVVEKLKMYVSYAYEGRVAPIELYKNTPVTVDMNKEDLDKLKSPLTFTITRKGHGIQVKGEVFADGAPIPQAFTGQINTFPGEVKTPLGTLTFERNPQVRLSNHRLIVTIHPVASIGASYAGRLSAGATTKTTTVAAISMTETQPERAIDYLSELITSYNEDANEDKNEVGRKTEQFIKSRIDVLKEELDSTEKQLEQYKIENKLINLANDATTALAGTNEYQKQQVAQETNMSIVAMLLDYLNNPSNASDVIPVNLGIDDQTLNKQIATYNQEIQTLNRLLRTEGNELNPIVTKLNNDVEILWDQIRSSVQRMYDELNMQKEATESQLAMFSKRIEKTPQQERQLNNISRQQEVKSGLYLMLLQKREENYISLASVASKARVIDSPKIVGKVSPKNKMIWMVAGVAGIATPIALIWLLSLLRYRIEGRQDVEKLTKLPILADIPLARKLRKGERAIVIRENSNGTMDEAFRGLRTNLRFVLSGDEKVLIVTSVIPGEGKTFVSTNLAMSMALMGKKVLIMGLDIRKPQLLNLFQLEDDKRGISTYLAGEFADFDLLEDQIMHGIYNDNLDILPAGIIPPNPGELISKDLLDKGIEHLRTIYDYIVLDTPPIGLVSDTLEMGRLADATLFVARADYSHKANFALINSVQQDSKMPKVNLVLNGIDLKKRKYGYYYGYGSYGKYGAYGGYAHYGHYGTYGTYGEYGDKKKKSKKR